MMTERCVLGDAANMLLVSGVILIFSLLPFGLSSPVLETSYLPLTWE